MIGRLLGWCVRRRGVVAVLTVLALALGCWAALRVALDVFPEFVPAQVDIQTEAPGFAPRQVEELVTRPIENAVNGAPGLATLRSQSIPGLSVITITFADGTDLYRARQAIAERLSGIAGSLPLGAAAPQLSPLVSSTMDLLKIGLVSDKVDAYALRDIADWTIKPRLLAVPGVAHVIVFGGSVRQIQILPDIQRLAAYNLTLTEVSEAARAALAVRGAGFIETAEQRVLIESPNPEPDIEALGQALVSVRNQVPIRLRDVAQIKVGAALRFGDSLVQGKPGVLLSLTSQYGVNTLATTRAVESALSELQPALAAQGIEVYGGLHRPANFIERALTDMEHALAIAALLILVVLYLFMRDVRVALIAFTSIPLSLLAAVMVMHSLSQTLNTMTLGGFAVALGVLVDDAVIGIENILRRLRLNAAAVAPQPRLDVIRDASLEVRGPVIYATAVVIAVFLPVLFTSSVQGHFIGPLALAFSMAVIASLIVAMTTTPALCALFLQTHDAPPQSGWLTRLKQWQLRAMQRVDARFGIVAGTLLVLAAAACVLLPLFGGTFMPDFREGHFVLQVSSAVPGTSLDQMLDVGRRISADVLQLPYVQSVEQQAGRAELSEDTWGPHRSELHVELKPQADVDQGVAQEALRRILQGYPGLQTEVMTFLGDRIGESLSGETAQVAVKLYGNDLDALDRTAARVAEVLRSVKGVVDLQFKTQAGTPAIAVEVSPAAVAAAGLKVQDVLDTLETAYAGLVVGQTFKGVRTVDAVVILPQELRQQLSAVGQLTIAGALGPVPLEQVARLRLTQDRYTVEHDGGQRRVSVTFNVAGRASRSVVTEARRSIEQAVSMPPGVSVEFAGTAQAEAQTRHELLLYSAAAAVLILVMLFGAFEWRANGWLVLVNLPFSLIGSVLAIALSGIGTSLGTLVGLVTVFGVSARNAILQLAHYEHLVRVEGASWNLDTVLRGANERLVPILMTAVVTALGLAPLAFGIDRPGQEIEGPMAITVLGGLASSTLLNLLVLPVLARRFSRPPGS